MDFTRRDFHKLTLAALGGAVSGTLAGCTGETPPAPGGNTAKTGTGSTTSPGEVASVGEPHLCRGLNACKNQDADGSNACAGQGDCASKEWHATCAGQNECKGRGGCGETAGANECKGKGSCHVPLMDDAWKKVRTLFEEKMKKAGKTFGDAPAKA